MKRGTPRAGKPGKVSKSRQPRKRAHRQRLPSKTFGPATDTGVIKTNPAPTQSRPFVAGPDATLIGRPQGKAAPRRTVTKPRIPQFDAIRVAELIEACRARVASLTELANVIARTLYELYDYDGDDPELWQCCYLVRQVLRQSQMALMPLGIVSHDIEPLSRAAEIARGCEAQRQWLRPAVHVIRATIHVLIDVKLDRHDEVLPALRDLESGLSIVATELDGVIQSCSHRADGRAAR